MNMNDVLSLSLQSLKEGRKRCEDAIVTIEPTELSVKFIEVLTDLRRAEFLSRTLHKRSTNAENSHESEKGLRLKTEAELRLSKAEATDFGKKLAAANDALAKKEKRHQGELVLLRESLAEKKTDVEIARLATVQNKEVLTRIRESMRQADLSVPSKD